MSSSSSSATIINDPTSPSLTQDDLWLVEAAYEIARFIQSFFTEDFRNVNQPVSNYSVYFQEGPNAAYPQTRNGLVLEDSYGVPSSIHTPYGRWEILGSAAGTIGEFLAIKEKLRERLGLTLIEPRRENFCGSFGPKWAITKWQGKEISIATDKPEHELISPEDGNKWWEKFKTSHPDLTAKC